MAKPPDDTGIPADPDLFPEASAKFRERIAMPKGEWEKLTAEQRHKAFTVAEVMRADIINETLMAMQTGLDKGTTFAEFQATAGPALIEQWGGEKPGRLETVFRTNMNDAYNLGRTDVITAPAVLRARPFWRFDGVDDDVQSEVCFAAMGTILPADDPWWASRTPPLHFNCRSVVTPLSEEEAEAEGIEDDPTPLTPLEGFGTPTAEKGADWVPDLTGYPEEIRVELAARLKKRG